MGAELNKHLCGNFTCATIGLVREILIENERFPRESWDLEPMRTRLQKRSQASQIVSAGTDGQAVFMQAVETSAESLVDPDRRPELEVLPGLKRMRSSGGRSVFSAYRWHCEETNCMPGSV